MAMKTDFLTDATSLSGYYYDSYYVLSKTHNINSHNLIQAHSGLSSEYEAKMTITLVLWIIVLIIFGSYMIFIGVKDNINRLNTSKNVLTILPISVSKTLPKMKDFCSMILRSKKYYGLL